MNNTRKDKPMCPCCKSKLLAFVPPQREKNITIYCSNANCKGVSISGHYNGYDILLEDLTNE